MLIEGSGFVQIVIDPDSGGNKRFGTTRFGTLQFDVDGGSFVETLHIFKFTTKLRILVNYLWGEIGV